MSNTFIKAVNTELTHTTTENGANAYNTTGDALLDLFGVLGSLRNADENRITTLFKNAFEENRLLATKMMFYGRNIRDIGLGEIRAFRIILKWMAINHPEIVIKNIHFIPIFGRWDDLYVLVGTPCEAKMWELMRSQLALDLDNLNKNLSISIMAKWLKSVNASNKEGRHLALKTAAAFGMNNEGYRKTLSKLRAHIDVVERRMCGNDWNNINYEGVPSKAMSNYNKAFRRHSPDKFNEYLSNVIEGKAKVNSSTLYPYEIFEKMGFDTDYGSFYFEDYDPLYEEQWKALPDYVTEDDVNILVMADTSGSMRGRPMATSVSLATYFAERNKGAFHNLFMTFSSEPEFAKLKGDSLRERIRCVKSIVDSTDLEKAFLKVLSTAVNGHVAKEDMPKAIVVISDNEINRFSHDSSNWDFLSVMRKRYADQGYELPNVVMWNVASRQPTYLANSEFRGVQFASGSSASVFKSLIANMGKTPWQAMVDTLNDRIFNGITV